MRVLIDTHIFLWFVSDDPKLSPSVKAILESDTDVVVSIASLWEISIKVSIGKLKLPGAVGDVFSQQLRLNQIELLPIAVRHLQIVSTLPFHHRDPFDRLIAAQSLADDIGLISVDTIFSQYGVDLVS